MEAAPTDTAGSIEFRVLGDIEVVADGSPLALGGRKSRELLAFLLLHANETVSQTRIVDALWGDDAPLTVEASLRVSVSKLRKTLEPIGARDLLETRAAGYVLRVESDRVDAGQFEFLAAAGRHHLAQGEPDEASRQLREALALWRGEPYVVIAGLAETDVERRRLGEIRLDVQDDLSRGQLALGLHQDMVPELEVLVVEQPARERRAGQLMLALYRCGRQADALEVYLEPSHRAAGPGLGSNRAPTCAVWSRRSSVRTRAAAHNRRVRQGPPERPAAAEQPSAGAPMGCRGCGRGFARGRTPLGRRPLVRHAGRDEPEQRRRDRPTRP